MKLNRNISDVTIHGKHSSKGDVLLHLKLVRSDYQKTIQFWLELNVEGKVYEAVSDQFDLWNELIEYARLFIDQEVLEWELWGIYKNQLSFSQLEKNKEFNQILLNVNLSLSVEGLEVLEGYDLSDIHIKLTDLKKLVDGIQRLYPEYEPPGPWVDLNYQETVDHISWIRDPLVEDEIQLYYIGVIDSTFPGASVEELIFRPHLWFNDESMLDAKLSNEEITQYLMSWAGKRLIGAETIDLPDITVSQKNDRS